jgi:Pretoxin HINT domain
MIGSIFVSALLAVLPFNPTDDAAALAEYNARRAEIPDTADSHWKLGLWAEEKGLKGEATVEFMAVARLEPTRDAAWKKLGFVKRDGRWVSSRQVAAEKVEAEAQRKADAKWLPILKKAKSMLAQKGGQAEAEATLFEIKDPRAIPSIWKVFGQGTAEDQERAIDILGRIDDESAAKGLAGLAIFGKTDLVRRVAVETLTRRNPNDVLMLWVGLLNKPVKYEVRQVAGPGSGGYLTVEGEKFNVRRLYSPPSMSQTQALFVDNSTMSRARLPLNFNPGYNGPPPGSVNVGYNEAHGPLYIFDHSWTPAWAKKPSSSPSSKFQTFERSQIQAALDRDFEISETAKMAEGAQAQLQQDVNTIEAGNAVTRELNARLAEALRRVSGKDFGDNKEAWLKWYMERRGYKYIPPEERPRPTVNVQVPLPYVPQSGPEVVTQGGGGSGDSKWCMIWEHEKLAHSEWTARRQCFAAGTIVLTPEGPRAIETLRASELVLTSDGPSDLANRPGRVFAVHHSRADRTLALTIGGETVVATGGHPLWKLGRGWIAAGELQVGDQVATRSGSSTVEAVELGPGAEVWNLEVAEGATYQVGKLGLVAHDLAPIEEILGRSADDKR